MAAPEPFPRLPDGLVARYLARLGLTAAPAPTPAALAQLHRSHLRQVPFENLDIHLGVPIVLDAVASARKIAEGGRGGFCYELNGAFGALLGTLGYAVELREARVFTAAGDEGRPFGHACLVVHGDGGPVLADVGFGRAFDEPLALVPAAVKDDSAGVFMLRTAAGGALDLVQDGVPQNRILPAARSLGEFADGCAFHQSSPDSTFTRGTVATIRTAAGRTTLSGLQLIETTDAGREERTIAAAELGGMLAERFGIALSADEADRLARVPARPEDARG
jgi:N-hydroxyarylamine O-acetyltransferase